MNYDSIYLVDDFDMVNLMHRILFRQLGMEEKVQIFTNPEEALQDLAGLAGEDSRILILLDINMPEMSGFEFLGHIESNFFPSNIDVVIVTSSVSGADRAMAGRYPKYVRDFVTKPLRLEKLRDTLESLDSIEKAKIP